MAYPYKKMTEDDFNAIRSFADSKRVYVGSDILEDYYHDEMPSYGVFPPELLVEVLNSLEVSKVMKYCNDNNIPVVARGAGTGLIGGAVCKFGGVMISLAKMNKIFPVDEKNMTITVQPGALVCEVEAAADAAGYFYAPRPGEMGASIGGNVNTNAGGMRAVRYGLTRDFVRCMEVVLPDGSIVKFSSNVVKNTTGYDLKNLIIGSEGTLGIVTEVTLKLLPKPNASATLLMPFESLEDAADMVPKILALPFVPSALEIIERELLDMVEKNLGKSIPCKDGEAVLFVQYDASSEDELEKIAVRASEEALENKAIDVLLADDPKKAAAIWDVRGSILDAMHAETKMQEECDIVVPRSEIARYIKAAKAIAQKYGLRVEPAGHAGDGNIHTQLLGRNDQSEEDFRDRAKKCLDELYALAKELGGQISGEHGIGNGRQDILKDFLGDRIIDLYRSVKLAFDPNMVLNPGKIIK